MLTTLLELRGLHHSRGVKGNTLEDIALQFCNILFVLFFHAYELRAVWAAKLTAKCIH